MLKLFLCDDRTIVEAKNPDRKIIITIFHFECGDNTAICNGVILSQISHFLQCHFFAVANRIREERSDRFADLGLGWRISPHYPLLLVLSNQVSFCPNPFPIGTKEWRFPKDIYISLTTFELWLWCHPLIIKQDLCLWTEDENIGIFRKYWKANVCSNLGQFRVGMKAWYFRKSTFKLSLLNHQWWSELNSLFEYCFGDNVSQSLSHSSGHEMSNTEWWCGSQLVMIDLDFSGMFLMLSQYCPVSIIHYQPDLILIVRRSDLHKSDNILLDTILEGSK